jgi:hypothetical protein
MADQSMTADYPMTLETFQPSWLYWVGAAGQLLRALVETWEEYQARWDMGWRDTPAAFGVETAPGTAVQVFHDPVPSQSPELTSDTYRDVLQLLVSHQGQQDVLAGRVDALEAQVAAVIEAVQALEPHEPARGRKS